MPKRKRYRSLAAQARALPPVLSVSDVCQLFGISTATVYREAGRGWPAIPRPLPHVINSAYKWLREDVIAWREHPDARIVASSKPGPRIVPSPRKVVAS